MSRQTIPQAIKDYLPKKCYNCGSTDHLVYHHIVPVEYGGNDTFLNIAVLCAECHGKVHFGDKGVICHGDMISKGMAEAKRRGVKLGRKTKGADYFMQTIAKYSTQFNDINDSEYELHTESEIMDMVNLSNTQYAKYKRMVKEAMSAPEWPYDWKKPTVFNNRPLYDWVIKKLRSTDNLFDHQKAGDLNG